MSSCRARLPSELAASQVCSSADARDANNDEENSSNANSIHSRRQADLSSCMFVNGLYVAMFKPSVLCVSCVRACLYACASAVHSKSATYVHTRASNISCSRTSGPPPRVHPGPGGGRCRALIGTYVSALPLVFLIPPCAWPAISLRLS